jgi:acetoacetyl-CoA synthetase
MDVQALDHHSKPTIDNEGELVCGKSFPSRPIYFLNDENNQKINEAYFIQNKGFWTHGDFVKITKNLGVIVYGRSDATLNPGGVRIGTSEIYRQTESFNFIQDAICVGRPNQGDVDVLLFVKMKNGEELTLERKKAIKDLIKKNTTPRHVPKDILVVTDIPYTRSGKKVELAIARILAGKPVTNIEALSNPECLSEYENYSAS